MKVSFNYKGNKMGLDVKNCNSFGKFFGLMFVSKKNAKALLFDFDKPVKINIHSCFVFFPFVGVFLDSKNNVLDLKVIKPWKLFVTSKKPFCRLIEIPINERYRGVVEGLSARNKNYLYNKK
ncbi:MAG: hypothetical protein ABH811_01120 [archaeon]